MAAGKQFSYRIEYLRRGQADWEVLTGKLGDVVEVKEGEKAAADLVFWALCPPDVCAPGSNIMDR